MSLRCALPLLACARRARSRSPRPVRGGALRSLAGDAVAPRAAAPPRKVVALAQSRLRVDRTGPRGDPEGWFTFQHAGDLSYLFVLDTSDPHSGARSLRIDNVGPEPYGAIAQAVEAAPYVGKVARFRGWLRTRDANDTGAALTLLVLAAASLLAHNFMAEAPVKGTTRLDALHDHAAVAEGRRAHRDRRDDAGQGLAVARRCRAASS